MNFFKAKGENETTQEKRIYHGRYFPHIDGLRAFAILPVLFYHLNSYFCPGGFAGVDIFFVISGYLITTHIIKDAENGSFSILEFYNRRIKRIIPAYFFMLFGVLLAAPALYYYEPLFRLSKIAFSSTFFAANFALLFDTAGYFRLNQLTSPLLHMWSLSIEEQFYIFLPPVVLICWKYFRKYTWAVFSLGFILSFFASSLSLYYSYRPNAAFFLLHSRAWELLAGSLLALYASKKPKAEFSWAPALSIAALAILLVSYYVLDKTFTFPGYSALPFVAIAAFLLRYGNMGPAKIILENPVLVFVGKISYPLYLWHWPIITFWKYARYDTLEASDYVLITILSLALSIFSWKFVETPIRKSKKWKKSHSFIMFGALAFVSSVICGVYFFTDGLKNYIHRDSNSLEMQRHWDPKPDGEKVLFGGTEFEIIHLGNRNLPPTAVFLGDSHAHMLLTEMAETLKDKNAHVIHVKDYVKTLYSADISFVRSAYYPAKTNKAVFEWIKSLPSVKKVIIANLWSMYDEQIDKGISKYHNIPHGLDKNSIFKHDFSQICEGLYNSGKEVLIMDFVPVFKHNTYVYEHVRRIIPDKYGNQNTEPIEEYNKRTAQIRNFFGKLEEKGIIRIIHVQNVFLDGKKYNGVIDGVPLYCDNSHFNNIGAKKVIRRYFSDFFE